MSKLLIENIKSIKQLSQEIYKLTIESEYISQNSKAGQFVNIKCTEGISTILRRPISICSVDSANKTFDVIFQKKGLGTECLCQKDTCSKIDLMGPLGKPFYLSNEFERIAVVGGGIGVFPLLFLLEEAKNNNKYAFLGFRNKEFVVLEDEFKKNSNELFITTDDGSYGKDALVTELLEKELEKKKIDIIYACGPMPMIKKVVDIAKKLNIKCQVSLEQRMGCGIGACLVCACKIKRETEWEYKHVCKDGPVFWSEEVIF